MDNIAWKPEYELGIKEIDAQHIKLVAILNTLIDAMRSGKGRQIAGDILKDLVSYMDTHFKTEEVYFEKFNYAETIAHVAEHEKLRTRVLELVADLDKNKLLISGELLRFLTTWLDGHIRRTDRKYITCFKENGLL